MDVRNMQKESTALEKGVKKENDKDYTNMIVYLRGARISLLSQEMIRRDLLNMLLDGQERGEGINEIFGNDLKGFLDEIIESHPVELKKDNNLLLTLKNFFLVFGIFLFAEILFETIKGGLQGEGLISLSLFTFLTPLILAVGPVYFVNRLIHEAFEESKKTKVLFFLFTALFLLSLSLGMTSSIAEKVSLSPPLWVGILIIGVSLVLYSLMRRLTKDS